MEYPAFAWKEGGSLVIEFPACPGCVTQVDPGQDADALAKEALEGWLETHLEDGEAPPRPPALTPRPPRGKRLMLVEVSPMLTVRLWLRWARLDAGLTQAELAKRAGVTQQQIAKLEHPDSNPTMETIEKVVDALSARLVVRIEAKSTKRAS